MHGLLGQSAAWHHASDIPPAIEGSDLDYVVQDGLLGCSFKYNLFTAGGPAAAAACPKHDSAGITTQSMARVLLGDVAEHGASLVGRVGGSAAAAAVTHHMPQIDL